MTGMLGGKFGAAHPLPDERAPPALNFLLFPAVEQILNGKIRKRIMMTAEKSYNFLAPENRKDRK